MKPVWNYNIGQNSPSLTEQIDVELSVGFSLSSYLQKVQLSGLFWGVQGQITSEVVNINIVEEIVHCICSEDYFRMELL